MDTTIISPYDWYYSLGGCAVAVEVAIVGTICATNDAIRAKITCHQEGMATEDTVVRNVP